MQESEILIEAAMAAQEEVDVYSSFLDNHPLH
jgi:hypothetical protein